MGRRAEKKRARRTKDRLSDLPDAIIHQILSFLDLKEAIQTCVLSKRWKYLWISVADLNFDCRDFTTSLKFTKFVSKVFSSRADDCNICKFRLHCCFKFDPSLLKRVFCYVVSHNVQHLDIHLPYSCPSLGPILTCHTLKTLKLNRLEFKHLSEPFGFGFTMLTSLHLYRCRFYYESTGSADPFANCTNLKILRLDDCGFSSLQVLKISGLQLLNLELGSACLSDGKVEIFAPKLASFYYDDVGIMDFSRLDMPSVNCVSIWLNLAYLVLEHENGTLVEKKNRILRLINLFKGLCNAQIVKLSNATIEYLKQVPGLLEQHPLPFKRLTSLKVEYMGKLPDHVKTYLLGDNSYEESVGVEDSPYGTTRFVEFRKVEA